MVTEHDTLLHLSIYLQMFLFGTLFAWYLQFLWKRRKLYKYAKLIPGPETIPILGNTHLLLGDGYGMILKFLCSNIQNYFKYRPLAVLMLY